MAEALPAWRQQRERGGHTLFRLMVWAAKRAPDWIADPVIWLFTLYYTLTSGKIARHGSDCYLIRVTGKGGFRRRFRHILTFAHVIYERAQLLDDAVEKFTVIPSDHEQIEDLVREGRSAILLGAHFGSFEALRAFVLAVARRLRPARHIAAAACKAFGRAAGGVGQLRDHLFDRSARGELDDREIDQHDPEQGRDDQQETSEDISGHRDDMCGAGRRGQGRSRKRRGRRGD